MKCKLKNGYLSIISKQMFYILTLNYKIIISSILINKSLPSELNFLIVKYVLTLVSRM